MEATNNETKKYIQRNSRVSVNITKFINDWTVSISFKSNKTFTVHEGSLKDCLIIYHAYRNIGYTRGKREDEGYNV